MHERLYATLLAVVVGGGCRAGGTPPTLDEAEIARTIATYVDGIGAEAARVTCPAGVVPHVGTTFACLVSIDGETYHMDVTVGELAPSTDKFDLDLQWRGGPVVAAARMEAILVARSRQMLDDVGGADTEIEVECGDGLLPAARAPFRCELRLGSVETTVQFDLDASGQLATKGTDDHLMATAKIERSVASSVQDQLGETVTVACGDGPVIKRPADGVVRCALGGDATGTIAVSTAEDATVTRWEAVTP